MKTIITPKKKFFDLDLREIWEYRYMILFFSHRDLKTVYLQTVLGPLWLIILPIVTSSLYSIVFGQIAKVPTDGDNVFLFFFCGTTIYSFFNINFSRNANLFNGYANLMKLIYFPRINIPISVMLSNFISLSVIATSFTIIYSFFGEIIITIDYLLIPLLILYICLFATCFGMFFSCLSYKYKDLANMTGIFGQLVLYTTPILYSANAIPQNLLFLSILNPVAYPMVYIRDILFNSSTFNIEYLYINISIGILISTFSIFLYSYVSKTFQDVI
jgi:lipopolysaccharide transport system permease protein